MGGGIILKWYFPLNIKNIYIVFLMAVKQVPNNESKGHGRGMITKNKKKELLK